MITDQVLLGKPENKLSSQKLGKRPANNRNANARHRHHVSGVVCFGLLNYLLRNLIYFILKKCCHLICIPSGISRILRQMVVAQEATLYFSWTNSVCNRTDVFWSILVNILISIKEARNSFFGLGVYLLKSKFRIEDKLWFPWYYTTFSTNDQRLFSPWFPSNSCHHSNGNGQPLILNNVEYLEN